MSNPITNYRLCAGRTGLIVTVISLSFLTVAMIGWNWLIRGIFTGIDHNNAQQNMVRIQNHIQDRMNALDQICDHLANSATRTPTLTDQNIDHILTHFRTESFIDGCYDYVAKLNSDLTIAWNHIPANQSIPANETQWADLIYSQNNLTDLIQRHRTGCHGIFPQNNHLFILSFRPVINATEDLPDPEILIVGQFLNPKTIAHLLPEQSNIAILTEDQLEMETVRQLTPATSTVIDDLPDNRLCTTALLNQVSGDKQLYLQLQSPATITLHYYRPLPGILWTFWFAWLLLTALLGWIIHRRILAPMHALAKWSGQTIDPNVSGDLMPVPTEPLEVFQTAQNFAGLTKKYRQLARNWQIVSDNVNVGIVLFDRDMKVIWASERICQITEKTIDLLIGASCHNAYGKCQWLCPGCDIVKSEAFRQEGYQLEKEIQSGQYYRIVYSPALSAKGYLTGFIACFYDISKQVLLERELRESEEKFRSLVENSHAAVIVATDKIEYCNHAFASAIGHDSNELIGYYSLADLVHPDMRSFVEHIQTHQLKKPGDTVDCEIECRHRDGSSVYFNIHGTLVILYDEPCMIISGVDITRLKRSLKALSSQNLLQGIVFDISRQFSFITPDNIDHTIQKALQKLGEHFKVDRVYLYRYLEHKNILVNSHEWTAGGIIPMKQASPEFLCENIPWWFNQMNIGHTLCLSRPDEIPQAATGVHKLFAEQGITSLMAIPVRSANTLMGVIGFDCIKREHLWETREVRTLNLICDMVFRALEMNENEMRARDRFQQLEQANRELSLSNRQMDHGKPIVTMTPDYFVRLGHEIQGPLNAMVGFSNLLADLNDQPSDESEYIDQIRANGRKSLDLVNDLLDLSRIEIGDSLIRKDHFSVRECIREIELTIQPEIQMKGIAFISVIDEHIPDLIYSDINRLRQCLLNLLRFSLADMKVGIIRLNIRPELNRRVRFDIGDNGPGIALERQKTLFDPQRSQPGRHYESSLKMLVTRKLAQLLGGNLSVISMPGRGASFSLTILAQSQDSQVHDTSPLETEVGSITAL